MKFYKILKKNGIRKRDILSVLILLSLLVATAFWSAGLLILIPFFILLSIPYKPGEYIHKIKIVEEED